MLERSSLSAVLVWEWVPVASVPQQLAFLRLRTRAACCLPAPSLPCCFRAACAQCDPLRFHFRSRVTTVLSQQSLSVCTIVGEAPLHNRQSVRGSGRCHWGFGPSLFSMLGIVRPLDCLSSSNQVIPGSWFQTCWRVIPRGFPYAISFILLLLWAFSSSHTRVYRVSFQKQHLWTTPLKSHHPYWLIFC